MNLVTDSSLAPTKAALAEALRLGWRAALPTTMHGVMKTDEDRVAPAVYWSASPVLAGESVLIAGAGLGTVDVKLCTGTSENCVAMDRFAVAVWQQSVQFSLPARCAPAAQTRCWALICATNTSILCAPPVALNAPDVTWSIIPTGEHSVLRVFGRSMAWDGETCLNSTVRVAAPGTQLLLSSAAGALLPLAAVPATAATCFEAEFRLNLTPGRYSATVKTALGVSFPFRVDIISPKDTRAPRKFDVDLEYGGDIIAALEAADRSVNATAGAAAEVMLGSRQRQYILSRPMNINDNVSVDGHNATIVFNLSCPVGECNPAGMGCMWGNECVRGPPCHGYAGAISARGRNWALRNVTIVVVAAPTPIYHSPAPTLWVHVGASRFSVTDVRVVLEQVNVSNAVLIRGATDFEFSNNYLHQRGPCETGEFFRSDSAMVMCMENVSHGLVRNNSIRWHCGGGWMLDSSEMMIVEDNAVIETNAWRDESASGCGADLSAFEADSPRNQLWSYARNRHVRPPHNNISSWEQHETVTSDGGAGWGAGTAAAFDGVNVSLAFAFALQQKTNTSDIPPAGATLLVIQGPGLGQRRVIVAARTTDDGRGQVTLDRPMDLHVTLDSVIAIIVSVGPLAVTGNHFQWGDMLQTYGTAMQAVLADNIFDNMNNCEHPAQCANGVMQPRGSLAVKGECYGGKPYKQPQPSFFGEITGNQMRNSNGISVFDSTRTPSATHPGCSSPTSSPSSFAGPFVRWLVVRRNRIGGVALSNPLGCGVVNATGTNESTDFIIERNVFDCPPGKMLAGGGVNVECAHCIVQATKRVKHGGVEAITTNESFTVDSGSMASAQPSS